MSLSQLASPSKSFQPSQKKIQNFRTFLYGCRDFFGGYGIIGKVNFWIFSIFKFQFPTTEFGLAKEF
jgi:hypothetical protein